MKKLNFRPLSIFLFILVAFFSGFTTTQAQTLKNFKSEDIGNPTVKGMAGFVKDGVDITAGGEDIWGNSDQFNFVYQPFIPRSQILLHKKHFR